MRSRIKNNKEQNILVDFKKVLIFLYDKVESHNLSRLIDEYHQKGVIITVVGPNVESSNSKDIFYKNIENYRTINESYIPAINQAHSLIEKWNKIKIKSSQSLDKSVSYEGISLWMANEINLLWDFLIPLIDQLNLIEKIIRDENPEEIVSLGGNNTTNILLHLLTQKHAINYLSLDSKKSKLLLYLQNYFKEMSIYLPFADVKVWIPKFFIRFLGWFKWLVYYISGKAWNLWSLRKNGVQRTQKKDQVVFLSLVKRFADIIIPIIEEIKRNNRYTFLIIDRKFSSSLPLFKEHGLPYKNLEGHDRFFNFFKISRNTRRLSQEWKRLQKDKVFKDSFFYNEINLWNFVKQRLDEYFKKSYIELMRIINYTREVIEAERPKLIVMTDVWSPLQKTFALCAKRMGIPVLNIQNAFFFDFPLGSPMVADKMAVDGEHFKHLISKLNGSHDKFVVTGQPRFDFITKRDRIYNRENTLSKFKIDRGKKLVVLFTEAIKVNVRLRDQIRLITETFRCMKNLREAQLVTKLHPSETDLTMYKNIAREQDFPEPIIIRDFDIWELLNACDLAIVTVSTVGYEAIIMDRPLIQVHISASEPCWAPYAEEGVALLIKKIDELEKALYEVIFNDVVIKNLKMGRERFISKYAYKLDGMASKRVVDLISEMIEKRGADYATKR